MSSPLSTGAGRLGTGSLLFAIGIVLAEDRMGGPWSKGVLLLVVLVPYLATVALVLAQAPAGNTPSPLTSLLCALAFAYGLLTVVRLGTIAVHSPGAHAGTVTWMALLVTAIGAGLAATRRSAAVALLALIALAVTVFAGADWLFHVHRDFATYRYIALGLAIVYALGALGASDWPRLATVLYVAAGLLVIGIAVTLLGTDRVAVIAVNGVPTPHGGPAWGWKVVVLLGGLGLAALAAARRDPGPGWAGALVLTLFVAMTASSVGHAPSLVGWPLVFLVVGAIVVVAAVAGSDDNARSLTQRPNLLAAGSLLLGIGVALAQLRMEHSWSKGVLLLVVLVPFVLTLAFALAQAREGMTPSGPTSLLSILALVYAVVVIGRAARLGVDAPFSHAGTVTWMAALATAVGAGLTVSRRSAGVALLTFLLAGTTVVVGVDWVFDLGNHLRTYYYVLFGVAIAYVLVGHAFDDWPRLLSVASVASGLAVALVALALVALTIIAALGDNGPADSHIAWGWQLATLLAALVLAAIAALRREAGPGYASALLVFLMAGLDLVRTLGHPASLVAWPLVLGILGAALALTAAFPRPAPRPAGH